MPPLFEGYF